MEGIGGVVTGEQIGVQGFEYGPFRTLMTEETNAVIAAAREAGVTEFVVADSHGSFQNLLVDKLPADVQLVRGTPRPYGMMQGLDGTFDGVGVPGLPLRHDQPRRRARPHLLERAAHRRPPERGERHRGRLERRLSPASSGCRCSPSRGTRRR